MSSRVGHTTKRHPLCPNCGYNLVATLARLDRDNRLCPECGESFTLAELGRTVAPEDWTLWRGVKRTLPTLFLRIALIALLWTGGLTLLGAMEANVPRIGPLTTPLILAFLVPLLVVIGGFVTGNITARGLDHRLGLDGPVVGVFAGAAALLAIAGGIGLAGLLTSPLVAAPTGVFLLGGLFALIGPARLALQTML